MKIEKVNENQIRCTLTKADLAERQIKLSELAYGTDKAKALFRDMMRQAASEFGFEADDIPLMIEAIPLSSECIVLLVTKVEYPEELDTRFSKFVPSDVDDDESDIQPFAQNDGATEILELYDKLQKNVIDDNKKKGDGFVPLSDTIAQEKDTSKDAVADVANIDMTALYVFDKFDNVIRIATVLKGYYYGVNSLYKEENDLFYLTINKSGHSPEEFNKVCNILSEYAKSQKSSKATIAYIKEHYKPVIIDDALQVLGQY
ncbi:adapter protein MecA 1/2 [Acetitomaculum ruminis DSM 5522]|uniref:Adapter protein MecA 1/2 n=1 Tax=Acetitomaculum ruminis DSM 5522 TaxID=1120918 RepID=A0A1I0YVI9_9FIRM|nr:adaptor protein MecA [Acetitomaculum ruminis]SFB16113.1 adapter protein MecA 1/2 [Acetitomaculum ruminis DSM 5522]